jgi:hypothetical protein
MMFSDEAQPSIVRKYAMQLNRLRLIAKRFAVSRRSVPYRGAAYTATRLSRNGAGIFSQSKITRRCL